MFTVRYGLSPYIKQTRSVFKGLKKGAKMRMGFSSFTAGSKAHVNILMTFVVHKGKVKKFVTVHAMKAGRRGTALVILNLSTKWWLVFNLTIQPLYLRRKNPKYQIGRWVGPRSGLDVVFHKK